MSLLPPDNFRSPAALMRFFLTTAVGLAVDLGTKHLAFDRLSSGVVVQPNGRATAITSGSYQFIPGWLDFNVTVNQGAVFGQGQGLRGLFLAVSVAAILFLIYLFATSGRQRFFQFILGLLMAGVLGNLYDRLVYGYVRDMIHALPGWHNPFSFLYDQPEIFPWIFNVADSLLCVGVALVFVYSLFHRPAKAAGNVEGSAERG